MRIYCCVTRAQLELLQRNTSLTAADLASCAIFAQSVDWTAQQDETDAEVLDDLILQEASQSDPLCEFVLVAEVPDPAISESGEPGQVQCATAIRSNDVAAYFAVDESGDLSWFGPTELPVLLELAK
jgi:hypothetical protein